jgi:hypothetical protein
VDSTSSTVYNGGTNDTQPQFLWSGDFGPVNDYIATLPTAQYNATIFIPLSLFSSSTTTVTFYLTLIDRPLLRSSSASVTASLTYNGGSAVVSSIASPVQVYVTDTNTLDATPYFTACGVMNVQWVWVSPHTVVGLQDIATLPSAQTAVLSIPPYFLAAGVTYGFTFNFNVSSPLGFTLGQVQFTVVTLRSAVVAVLSPSGSISLPTNGMLTLDASQSYDMDDNPTVPINQLDSSRMFNWSVCAYSTTTSSCDSSGYLPSSLTAISTLATAVYNVSGAAVPFPIGTYQFTVTFNRFFRSSTTSVLIQFKGGSPPVVTVQWQRDNSYASYTNLNPQEALRLWAQVSNVADLSKVTYSWSLVITSPINMAPLNLSDASIAPLGISTAYFKISAGVLNGAKFTATCDVKSSATGLDGYGGLTITAAAALVNGSLWYVAQYPGSPLTSLLPITLYTGFWVEANNLKPTVTFWFSYVDPVSGPYPLQTAPLTTPYVQTNLPIVAQSGTMVAYSVLVTDTVNGVTAIAYDNVTVQAVPIDSSFLSTATNTLTTTLSQCGTTTGTANCVDNTLNAINSIVTGSAANTGMYHELELSKFFM